MAMLNNQRVNGTMTPITRLIYHEINLVGGWKTISNNMNVNRKDDIPYIMEK